MSKAEINNEIVLMRKNVRQARVCCIRKWTRKSNKLKNRKGTESQVEKFKRLSDKIVAQILALKGVKDDVITKFALTNKRTQKEISEDQTLSPRERALGQLIFYNKFQQRINEFKAKFPNYEEYIDDGDRVLAKKKFIQKENLKRNETEQPKQNNKNKKTHHNNEDNEDDEKEESDNDSSSSEDLARKYNIKPGSLIKMKPVQNDSEESTDDEDEDDDDDEQEIKNELNNKRVDKMKQQTSPKKMNKLNNSPKKNVDIENKSSPKKQNKMKKRSNFKDNAVPEIIDKKKIKVNKAESSTNNSHQEENVLSKNIVKKDVQKEADPFFVSGDSTYMRIKAPKSYEVDQKTDFHENKFVARNEQKCQNKKTEMNKFSNSFNSKGSRNSNDKFGNKSFDGKEEKFGNKSFNWQSQGFSKDKFNNSQFSQHGNEKFGNKHFNNKNDTFNKNKFGNKYTNGDIKRNSNEHHFAQNKSKTFNQETQNKSKNFAKLNEGQKQSLNKSTTTQQNLHPSWEAKKKQQEALKLGFQGKKIVFDD